MCEELSYRVCNGFWNNRNYLWICAGFQIFQLIKTKIKFLYEHYLFEQQLLKTFMSIFLQNNAPFKLILLSSKCSRISWMSCALPQRGSLEGGNLFGWVVFSLSKELNLVLLWVSLRVVYLFPVVSSDCDSRSRLLYLCAINCVPATLGLSLAVFYRSSVTLFSI